MKEKTIYHTVDRIKWDSVLIQEKLNKANSKLQLVQKATNPNIGYLRALESKIVWYMSRLHFLHQEERVGRIHSWDLLNGEQKELVFHKKDRRNKDGKRTFKRSSSDLR